MSCMERYFNKAMRKLGTGCTILLVCTNNCYVECLIGHRLNENPEMYDATITIVSKFS